MSSSIFLHQLAVERCQHSLAQLSALFFLNTGPVVMNGDHEESGLCDIEFYQESVRVLIEDINRDLTLIRKTVEGGELHKLKTMLCENVGSAKPRKKFL